VGDSQERMNEFLRLEAEEIDFRFFSEVVHEILCFLFGEMRTILKKRGICKGLKQQSSLWSFGENEKIPRKLSLFFRDA